MEQKKDTNPVQASDMHVQKLTCIARSKEVIRTQNEWSILKVSGISKGLIHSTAVNDDGFVLIRSRWQNVAENGFMPQHGVPLILWSKSFRIIDGI